MATRIDGKAVAAKIRAQVAQDVEALKARGICPGMAVVLVGDDPASKIYVNNKKKPARRRASTPKSTCCPQKPHRKSCSR